MGVSECFDQIWKKYREDLKVCEAFKRIGPAFPLPGPHYDYLDLIEHIRYTLFKLCTCSPEDIYYHLDEIFRRLNRLGEFWLEEIKSGLTGEEYDYYKKHIRDTLFNWVQDVENYLKNICEKKQVDEKSKEKLEKALGD
jgi:hypothetical protein